MLSLLGFLTICVFLGLILTKRLSVLLSLILVPVVFALIGGFGPKEIGEMVLSGYQAGGAHRHPAHLRRIIF